MNRNPSISTSFAMEISRLPGVNYFVQKTELPSLTMGGIEGSFRNHQLQLPSNKIEYDTLPVTFLVDEDWKNYRSIVKWYYECRTGNRNITQEMSDITLYMTNSNKNFKQRFIFESAFPVSISSISLDSAVADSDPTPCTITFKYQKFRTEDEP